MSALRCVAQRGNVEWLDCVYQFQVTNACNPEADIRLGGGEGWGMARRDRSGRRLSDRLLGKAAAQESRCDRQLRVGSGHLSSL